MRFASASCAVIVGLSVSAVAAQQPDQPSSGVFRLALQTTEPSSLVIPPSFTWGPPTEKLFGFLTLVPQQKSGEIVRLKIPLPELAAHVTRKVSNARHRRSERKAREAVERDLRDFLAQRPPQ